MCTDTSLKLEETKQTSDEEKKLKSYFCTLFSFKSELISIKRAWDKKNPRSCHVDHFTFHTSLIILFQATKALHKALSARQDLSFKGPRVQSALPAPTERSLVKFGGLTEKRTKDQKALVHLA